MPLMVQEIRSSTIRYLKCDRSALPQDHCDANGICALKAEDHGPSVVVDAGAKYKKYRRSGHKLQVNKRHDCGQLKTACP